MADEELRRRIEALEARQNAVEKFLRSATSNTAADQLTKEHLADLLRQLGSKIVLQHPNGNYFNERFRGYELLLLNVKNLGYYLGQELYRQHKPREIAGPSYVPLSSRLCTQRDVESEWFAFWCQEMRTAPGYHRKLWELCFVAQGIYNEGKLTPGSRGLGFGCGQEPLPALFAKYGAQVLATDLDPSRPEATAWQKTNQHATAIELLRRRDICPDEELRSHIDLRYVDMNNIPREFDNQFDFCWSACSLEHLGSIANGLDFIENSLRTLKSGGIAIHTTEFNLHDGDTIDHWPTVLYQKHHFIDLAERLSRKGYRVLEIDFGIGDGVLDGFVDVPPSSWNDGVLNLLPPTAHLKLGVDGFICTSFGIIVCA